MLPLNRIAALTQAGNWQQIYSSSQVAPDYTPLTGRTGIGAIEPFDIPVLFSSPIILAHVVSSTAKPTWHRAGTLIQVAPTPFLENEIPEDDLGVVESSILARHYPRLNWEPEVFELNNSVSDKRLTFYPVPWLERLTIKVFEYTGPISTLELEELAAIRVKLEAIDTKIGS